MRTLFAVTLGTVVALLAGCSALKGPAVGCTTEQATATALSVVSEQIEKAMRRSLKRDDGTAVASTAKVRATLKQLKISVEDIRTSKEDPNSTKKFCTGTLTVIVPDEAIRDAEKAREVVGQNTVEELADQQSVERSANRFTTDISYNVQPTDNGDKVYAEIEDGDNIYSFFSQLLSSHLARKVVENAQAEEQQAIATQQREDEAAAQEQKAATFEEARAQNKLAEQTINEVWAAIPSDSRSSLLEIQRAWIKRKSADCKIQAASESTDNQDRKSAQLRCEARMNYERANELRRYVDSSTTGM